MNRLLRHKLLVGGVALVVAGSAGGAYAASQTGTGSRQVFFNDVAKRLNVSPSQLRAALRGAFLDRLDAAVKAGQLTQAQANAIKQRTLQGGGVPLGPVPGPRWQHAFAPAFAPGGPPKALARHSPLGSASSYLGLSVSQLLSDLRDGKSLAQVARAEQKSVAGLEQALVSAAKARLSSLVSAGALTQAQEQRLLNRLNVRIDRMVNGTLRLHPKREFLPPGAPPAGPPPVGGALVPVPGVPPPPGA